ncbi:MAG TPA: PssD/Cps14F family polysaccharide biosynthesis glycosyltransferase [Caldilineaceae bacterium]|nr:PssD/Cps14F family polysaccharide biosynthesis glycosyltransferase [Caldilineaceae bacterium]
MKVCLVSSAGGHFTETLQILDAFTGDEIFFVTWHSAREADIQAIAPAYFLEPFGTSPWRAMASLPRVAAILRREQPDVIISLGAEIALPFFFLAKLMGIRTIFIESWCRIDDLSKTGKLLYRVADEFLVQWPELLKRYGARAKYEGAVI